MQPVEPVRRSPTSKPASSHFGFLARPKLYGVFDDLDGVLVLTRHLLDLDGRHHGLVARFVRALQGMTDEKAHLGTYVRHLLRGRVVVAVSVPRGVDHRAVCAAFRTSGSRDVHSYGPFVFERVSA